MSDGDRVKILIMTPGKPLMTGPLPSNTLRRDKIVIFAPYKGIGRKSGKITTTITSVIVKAKITIIMIKNKEMLF
jgi:hypothetical protein